MDRSLQQAVAVITFFLLVGIALWVNARVEELAVFLHVSPDASWSVVKRSLLPAILLCVLLYNGKFIEALCFLPASAMFSLSPAFTYWSWDVVAGMAMNDSPAWYGRGWLHILAILVLAAIPTWWFWLRDRYWWD